jgi:hypothetical protein
MAEQIEIWLSGLKLLRGPEMGKWLRRVSDLRWVKGYYTVTRKPDVISISSTVEQRIPF